MEPDYMNTHFENNLIKEILDALSEQKELLIKNEQLNKEIIWANIFHDTIKDSPWLIDQKFSLGRWAIGYPCAYLLYRTLDECKPKSILELGLGQSTKFTSQYVAANKGINHIVIESDKNWISFFKSRFALPKETKIHICPWTTGSYKQHENIRIFDGFHNAIAGLNFDLIFIDAPLGSDMKNFSRIDVLKELPNCLSDSFVIILDDYNRIGEKHTAIEMVKTLKANNIECFEGVYKGEEAAFVVCSEDNKFIKTM